MPRTVRPRDPQTGEPLLKMSELAARSGLPAPTIAHYQREGLLAAPVVRTGRTMAWYAQSGVERLRQIRALQEDHYLPLAVIRQWLRDGCDPRVAVAAHAVAGPPPPNTGNPSQSVGHWLALGVSEAELAELAQMGILSAPVRPGDVVIGADAELLDLLVRARAAGLDASALPVSTLAAYRAAVVQLVDFEVCLFREHVLARTAQDAMAAVQAAVALSEAFVLHMRRRLLLPALERALQTPATESLETT